MAAQPALLSLGDMPRKVGMSMCVFNARSGHGNTPSGCALSSCPDDESSSLDGHWAFCQAAGAAPVMQNAMLRGGGVPDGMDMPFGVSGAS